MYKNILGVVDNWEQWHQWDNSLPVPDSSNLPSVFTPFFILVVLNPYVWVGEQASLNSARLEAERIWLSTSYGIIEVLEKVFSIFRNSFQTKGTMLGVLLLMEKWGKRGQIKSRWFRYNVAAGGHAKPFEDDIYDELAIRVAESVGLKISGLDILPSDEGKPIIIEANCYSGYKAFFEKLLRR